MDEKGWIADNSTHSTTITCFGSAVVLTIFPHHIFKPLWTVNSEPLKRSLIPLIGIHWSRRSWGDWNDPYGTRPSNRMARTGVGWLDLILWPMYSIYSLCFPLAIHLFTSFSVESRTSPGCCFESMCNSQCFSIFEGPEGCEEFACMAGHGTIGKRCTCSGVCVLSSVA